MVAALNTLREKWLLSFSSPPLGEITERAQAVKNPFFNSLLDDGLFELRGTRVRIYYGFLPGRRAVLVGGYVKKRTDTPVDVLRLMRARLKEVEDEHKKSRTRVARKKA